jgi:two-component system, NarL family, sensor histidine kinase DesK
MTGTGNSYDIARRAPWLLLTLHLSLLVMSPILVATEAFRRHTVTQLTFAVVAGAVITAVHLRHVRAAAMDDRPPAWQWTLALQGALVYAPLAWLGPDWSSTALPLAASAMLMLPRPWGVPTGFVSVYLITGFAYAFQMSELVSVGDTVLLLVYYTTSFTVFAFMLYSTARLTRLVNELYHSRAELAEIAVGEERMRVSRDLHDLLGQSLSAISLKGDLADRLLSLDPARARHEISSLTELARSTLRDIRAVTRDEHRVTLQEEIAAAQGLLVAAGVEARIDTVATGLDLPDAAQQVLAWAVREGTTNLLRHSEATTCTITLTRAAGVISLDMRNNGVRRPLLGDGSGLAGLEDRAADAGGWARAEIFGGDQFHLRVELPETRAASDHT